MIGSGGGDSKLFLLYVRRIFVWLGGCSGLRGQDSMGRCDVMLTGGDRMG